ncbi:MAG: helix-turn-helix domain-containing protein [Desulfovibrionaceae bacterium]|nr:helix-turn-helix domain-containing protein [Desulfovibrionaceae bacterium]
MEKIPGLNWAIAKTIKKARESKGLTQNQLADFAGLSEVYISKLERGIKGDSVNALMQISVALEMAFSDLMKLVEAELLRGARKIEPKQGRPRQCEHIRQNY